MAFSEQDPQKEARMIALNADCPSTRKTLGKKGSGATFNNDQIRGRLSPLDHRCKPLPLFGITGCGEILPDAICLLQRDQKERNRSEFHALLMKNTGEGSGVIQKQTKEPLKGHSALPFRRNALPAIPGAKSAPDRRVLGHSASVVSGPPVGKGDTRDRDYSQGANAL